MQGAYLLDGKNSIEILSCQLGKVMDPSGKMQLLRKEWRVKEVQMLPRTWAMLPFELLVLVLIGLPLRTLLSFRLVSKAWRQMIDSPAVARKVQEHGQPVIFYHDPGSGFSSYLGPGNTRRNRLERPCLFYARETSHKWLRTILPFENLFPIRNRTIAQSKHVLVAVDLGLMCFIKMGSCVGLVIYNPLTGQWRDLSLPPKLAPLGAILKFTRKPTEYVIVGLSVSEESGDYTLVIATVNFHFPFMAFTYCSSSRCWREIHHVPLEVLEEKREIIQQVKRCGGWRWSFCNNHAGTLFWTADVYVGDRRALFVWLQCSVPTFSWTLLCGDVDRLLDVDVECQLYQEYALALNNWSTLEEVCSLLGKVWRYKPIRVIYRGECQQIFVSYLDTDHDTCRMEIRCRRRQRSQFLPRLTIPRDHHVKSIGAFIPTLKAFV